MGTVVLVFSVKHRKIINLYRGQGLLFKVTFSDGSVWFRFGFKIQVFFILHSKSIFGKNNVFSVTWGRYIWGYHVALAWVLCPGSSESLENADPASLLCCPLWWRLTSSHMYTHKDTYTHTHSHPTPPFILTMDRIILGQDTLYPSSGYNLKVFSFYPYIGILYHWQGDLINYYLPPC